MNNFFYDFNKEQLKAITSDANTIGVYAGPGTGKTKTLVGKYIYLLQEKNVKQENILCITFTRKAAQEMKEKISKECDLVCSKYISTIHSLGHKILTEDIFRIGFANKFSMLTDSDQNAIIFDIMRKMNLYEDDNITYSDIVNHISKNKNANNASYITELLDSSIIENKIKNLNGSLLFNRSEHIRIKLDIAYYRYLQYQSLNFCLDYDDLILLTIYALSNYKIILNKWSSKFQYILVDEFQDLTRNEYNLIQLLATEHKRIFGVGDPNQCIYSFRGSDIKIFDYFYNSCEEKIDLIKNYRSYQEIVNLGYDLIKVQNASQKDIKLQAVRGVNKEPIVVHTVDRYAEAIYVANKIQELTKKGIKRNECAILYRNNLCTLVFEEYFQLKKIPYKVYSNNEFFKCDEIKTALSYMKFAVYKDDLSFLNIYKKPTRYISNLMINRIKELAANNKVSYWQVIKDDYKNPIYKKTLDGFIDFVKQIDAINEEENLVKWCLDVLNKSGYLQYVFSIGDEDKINHIKQLLDMISFFEPESQNNKAVQFLNYIALLADGDVHEEEDKVQMMSIHCSKGMQFKYVFLTDFNEGFIPSVKAETVEQKEEERRVAYVAFTRAKDELYILESKGDEGKLSISSFSSVLNEGNHMDYTYIPNDTRNQNRIKIGSYVMNKFYGKGIVKNINIITKQCEVKFDDYYQTKNVDLNTLMNVIDLKKTAFPQSLEIVEKIKKDGSKNYYLGEIVINNTYGNGIIIKLRDDNTAVVQFGDFKGNFDLNSNYILRRDDVLNYYKSLGEN